MFCYSWLLQQQNFNINISTIIINNKYQYKIYINNKFLLRKDNISLFWKTKLGLNWIKKTCED